MKLNHVFMNSVVSALNSTKHLRKHLLTSARYFDYLKRIRPLSDILDMTHVSISYHSTVWPIKTRFQIKMWIHRIQWRRWACSWPEQRVECREEETCRNVWLSMCTAEAWSLGEVWRGSSQGTDAPAPAVSLQLAKGQMNALHLPDREIRCAVIWLGKHLASQKRWWPLAPNAALTPWVRTASSV